jgi:hypothetical protein
MRAHHIQEALGAVQILRQAILDRQSFRGFSGPARITSGLLALGVAALLAWPGFPATHSARILAWGGLFGVALVLNVGALAYWFWHDGMIQRNPRRLTPVLDILPPLAIGALLTFVFLLQRDFHYLFGTWMCMFGLANLAGRHVMPRAICGVGLFYVAAGLICLVSPAIQFANPWPMGLVFGVGELVGGFVLYLDQRRYASLGQYAWVGDATPPEESSP